MLELLWWSTLPLVGVSIALAGTNHGTGAIVAAIAALASALAVALFDRPSRDRRSW